MAGQISFIIVAITLLVHAVAVATVSIVGLTPGGPPPFAVAEQVAATVRVLDAVPAAARAATLAHLAGVRPADCAVPPAGHDADDGSLAKLIRGFADPAPSGEAGAPARSIVVAGDTPARARVLVGLRGGGCVLIDAVAIRPLRPPPPPPPIHFELPFLIILFGSIALPIVLLSVWATRHVTTPLARLAASAERLGREGAAPPLPEEGPVEIRHAARAFNAMQERLRRLVEDRTRMLAAISHDFRTILTRLRLRAEAIADPAAQMKTLRDIGQMEAMIASTLAFVRDEAHEEPESRIDLSSLLESLCEEQADLGHAVRYDGPAGQRIACRPLALGRAIGNLIENALKYAGSVAVGLEAVGAEVAILVADDGPGIPAAERERVFEPFYRLDSARTDAPGVGLGLAIVRAIIHAHGGAVALGDNQPRGLVVRVTLPVR